MNKEISKLFDEIDKAKELIAPDIDFSLKFLLSVDIKDMKVQIQKISSTLNNHAPEPWASMTAKEIKKGIKTA